MDIFKIYKPTLPCLIVLVGCGNTAGEAYTALLSGAISLFDSEKENWSILI